MTTEVRLENWRFCVNTNGFQTKGMDKPFLRGDVYGHPGCAPGESFDTPHIVSVVAGDPTMAVTEDGSRYRMGVPHAGWVAWLADQGLEIDPEQPFPASWFRR